MREIRPYGSEGGGAAALPTPIFFRSARRGRSENKILVVMGTTVSEQSEATYLSADSGRAIIAEFWKEISVDGGNPGSREPQNRQMRKSGLAHSVPQPSSGAFDRRRG